MKNDEGKSPARSDKDAEREALTLIKHSRDFYRLLPSTRKIVDDALAAKAQESAPICDIATWEDALKAYLKPGVYEQLTNSEREIVGQPFIFAELNARRATSERSEEKPAGYYITGLGGSSSYTGEMKITCANCGRELASNAGAAPPV